MNIRVSEHAYWRTAERFPGFDTALIEEEVRSAITAGRIAPSFHCPENDFTKYGLYAWTPARDRVYAMKATNTEFIVITALKPGMRGKQENPVVRRAGVVEPPAHSDNQGRAPLHP